MVGIAFLAIAVAPSRTTAQNTPLPHSVLRTRIEQLLRALSASAAATPERLQAIARLSIDERRMYGAVLDTLDWLRGSTNPGRIAEYMFRVMTNGAAIAPANGARFVALVGMAFSRPDGSRVEHHARQALGAGEHKAGILLEAAYRRIASDAGGSTAQAGFRPDVLDKDPQSTVTHHFGEFLQIGAAGAVRRGRAAQYVIDPTNPTDRNNGFFALMVGYALARARLTSREMIDLTRWAFTTLDPVGTPPWAHPYGSRIAAPFRATVGSGYHLPTWIEAFNAAHPARRIPTR